MQVPSASSLRERQLEGGFLFPAYDDWCFSRIPGTVGSLLGADVGPELPTAATEGYDDVERVVVFLVDGFGLAQWDGARSYTPLLRQFEHDGRVTPLTSVYPSETAAAMNTFHSGVLTSEHGVIGWNVYEPAVDEQFEALPFLRKDGTKPEGMAYEDIANAESVYRDFDEAGVEVHQVTPFPNGGTVPHEYDPEDLSTFPDAFEEAAEESSDADGPTYVFAYLPQTDAIAHGEGVDSEEYRKTVEETFENIECALDSLAEHTTGEDAGETLVCLTADHGLIDTGHNIDLSEPPFDLVPKLKTLTEGTPIRFSGSPRNVNLHLQDEHVEAVYETLSSELDAKVFRKREVLGMELFGPDPSPTFERRVGDLVVVHRELGVWFGDEEPHALEFVAMHGGLHPDEMLIPFATATLDSLR
ncbi:alkaline phosphatase family protein [Haloferax namakaokahaiae]|uniref:Alkaline phosphatase family protein n=1 Tax=Haloferax namakaokahaiae TaxID=1748331 RepID=A0ABD5ZF16_9EURY